MREMKDSGVEWIGEIPRDWKVERLKALFMLQRGHDLTHEEFKGGIYPVCGSNGIIGYHDKKTQSAPCITIGRSGSVGAVNYYDEECWVHNTAISVIDFRVNNAKYIYYILRSLDMDYLSTKTAVPTMDRKKILNYTYCFTTDISNQTAIADYLDQKCAQVDALITNIQTQIEKLKAYKQSVITEVVTKGLDPNVPMKDSGVEWIGEIPGNYEVKPLMREIDSIVDYRGKTPEKVAEGTLLVTARNIKEGKIDYEISREYVKPEDYDEIMHRGKPEIGDLLFTTEAPLGAVANVDRTDFALAQRIIKFKTRNTLNSYYLKYWMLSSPFQQHLKSYATGSTATGIKASKLCLLQLVYPPIEEQKEIAAYLDKKCSQIDNLISLKQSKIEKLEQYKKSLIYEYVTGKKEVE